MKKNIYSIIGTVIAAVAINSFRVPETNGISIYSNMHYKGSVELISAVKEGIRVEYKKTNTNEIIKFGESIAIYYRFENERYISNRIPDHENISNITDLISVNPSSSSYKRGESADWANKWWIFLTKSEADYLEDKILEGKSFEIHNTNTSKKHHSSDTKELYQNLKIKLYIDNELAVEKKPYKLPKLYRN